MTEDAIPRPAQAKNQGKRRRDATLRPLAPIVPSANVSGRGLIAVIAIMSFLCCLTLGAVSMIRSTASAWQSQISREITIQIKPAEGLDMDQALDKVRMAALAASGVTSASVVDRAATERLLEPWLGEGFDIDELPVPRLVIVTVDEAAPPDFEALRAALALAVPEAVLDDHRAWAMRLVAMARTTIFVGFGILGLMFTATMLTVIFVTRGAMAGNRHIIEVLHFVGAETGFIASEFQRRFLFIGLKGSAIGGLLAAISFLLLALWQGSSLATPLNDQATALFGQFYLSATGYGGIVFAVLLIAAMTTVTSRFTVIRAIREIDRQRSDTTLIDLD